MRLTKTEKAYIQSEGIDINPSRKQLKQLGLTKAEYNEAAYIFIYGNETPQQRFKRNNRERVQKFRQLKQRKQFIGIFTITVKVYLGFKEGPKPEALTMTTLERARDREGVYEIRNYETPFTFTGTEREVKDNINDLVQNRIEGIKMEYSILGIDESSIRVTSNYEAVRPADINNIRMKRLGYNLDGYAEQKWDTDTGKCVFDYLLHKYQPLKSMKSLNIEMLKEIMTIDVDVDMVTEGVNTYEIRKFCERYNIAMIALDDEEDAFNIFTPSSRNKHVPTLMFRISNNHFYPIEDANLKKSIAKRTLNDPFSEDIDKKESKKATNIKAFENVDDTYEVLGKLINETKTIPKNGYVKMRDGKIFSIQINDTLYYINRELEKCGKSLCAHMNIAYENQGIGTLIYIIVEEVAAMQKYKPFLKSSCNTHVQKTLIDAKQNRVHYGFLEERFMHMDVIPERTQCWDISKCYTSCLYHPVDDWMIFDYNDIWEDFDGVIKFGIYYVETSDRLLLNGSNYYSNAIVQKALDLKIHLIIKKQLIPSHKLSKNFFKQVIDKINEYAGGDVQTAKLAVNMLSGLLGQHRTEITKVGLESDINQIFSWIHKHQYDKDVLLRKVPDTNLFLYGHTKYANIEENNVPMYIQILDQSNMRLYDMIQKMCISGGQLISRKTDCAVVYHNYIGPINKDPNEKFYGGYRSSEMPYVCNVMNTQGSIKYTNCNDWIDHHFNDSNSWLDILNVLDANGGLLLQGGAGNGKSYVAKKISECIFERGDVVKRLAPTNKAAININGSTIHKFFQLTKDGKLGSKFLRYVHKKQIKYIIIDEISMITKDLWKKIALLKQATEIKFLLIGDSKQCPPVENEKIEDYFNHPTVKFITNNNRNKLTVMKRFDKVLYDILENVNDVDVTKYPAKNTPRNLCFFNRTRKIINAKWNNFFRTEGDIFIPEDKEDEYTQDMYIYKDLPVIARKTVDNGEIMVNNEYFKVKSYNDEYISLYNDRIEIDVLISQFSQQFLLNYCSTTHKAQGETIDEEFTIYDWKYMNDKIKYTALSRATCIDNVGFGNTSSSTVLNENVITQKLLGHQQYDNENNLKNDINMQYIKSMYINQGGQCKFCNVDMKTYRYKKNDDRQLSIDRIDSNLGHIKGNIQLLCWGCNRAKMDRC